MYYNGYIITDEKKRNESTLTFITEFDVISIEGYLQDEQKADELGHFCVSFNAVPDAISLCYIEHGNNKALAMT